MPIATPEVYGEMLDRAKAGRFAYPAINVTSTLAERGAQGLRRRGQRRHRAVLLRRRRIRVRQRVKDMVVGAIAMAEFARVVAAQYPVNIALHTDHCPPNKLDGYMRPLIEISKERVTAGQRARCSSRTCGTARRSSSRRTSRSRRDLLEGCAAAHIVMELEIGVVGGEEDGVANEINEKLYTTPEDVLRTAEVLGLGENGRYLLAATFGNVHGIYKPGDVKLRPGSLGRSRRGRRQVRPG